VGVATAAGTAESCGEDFHGKISDCGAFVRRILRVLLVSPLFVIHYATALRSVRIIDRSVVYKRFYVKIRN
jgi:hypothetical protein